MLFMNEYDIAHARNTYSPYTTPNRAHLAATVASLAEWADNNSDGWAYWPLPLRAANKAMALIESTTNAENDRRRRTDATDAETRAALRPIKAFLRTQNVDTLRSYPTLQTIAAA